MTGPGDLFDRLFASGWTILGLAGSLCFASRWFVQVAASRRARRPVTPVAFWVISCFGSLLLLSYFALSPGRDPVGLLSNSFPMAVATYNLTLAMRGRPADPAARPLDSG